MAAKASCAATAMMPLPPSIHAACTAERTPAGMPEAVPAAAGAVRRCGRSGTAVSRNHGVVYTLPRCLANSMRASTCVIHWRTSLAAATQSPNPRQQQKHVNPRLPCARRTSTPSSGNLRGPAQCTQHPAALSGWRARVEHHGVDVNDGFHRLLD